MHIGFVKSSRSALARWLLILLAALVVGAGLIAGLISAVREPAESPTASPAQPTMAALPLQLPTAASANEAAASASPQPAAPVAPAPSIGSEGYGPHIESAQAGQDLAAVWQAVQWLQLCASNELRRNAFELTRNQGVAPEAMTLMMVQADAEARRCQTVTAQHRAMLPELAARAMRGGVPLAAEAYARAVSPADLTAAQRQEVADALRRDAVAVGVLGLLAAVQTDDAWGLSDADKLGFLAALKLLGAEPGSVIPVNALLQQNPVRFKTPPTPEQQAAANLAGQKIVDRLNADNRP
jgi:hypothetical protein